MKPFRRVVVVGSANMDVVLSCDRFPRPGETVLAADFGMYSGGKGANQAMACARLGADVAFLARIGNDEFGARLSENLRAGGVDLAHVLVDDSAPTGIAVILVDESGQNEIVVVSGSNMKLSPDDVRRKRSVFEGAGIVLLQLEIPLETVQEAAVLGREAGARVILNPAPASDLPDSLLAYVDVLTPNEPEAEAITGVRVRDRSSTLEAARKLLRRGVSAVVVTLGARGVLYVSRDVHRHIPAHRVVAVDTTAAGDAFSGALACGLVEGRSIEEAIDYANAVAAIAVTRMGAQASMPSSEQVESFLRDSSAHG